MRENDRCGNDRSRFHCNSIIRAIKRLYENTVSKIKIGKQLFLGFNVTKGLQQGCSLSPTLFKIYIQNALEN